MDNELTMEELTERFYRVRDQRNKLLWACQKALAAFDEANKTGKSNWSGEDVTRMRTAVGECLVIRSEEANQQSMDDLAASGGIVDAP